MIEDESAEMDGEESSGEDEGGSFFVPKSALGDHECKPGDKLTFEVVGVDSEGEVEVKFSGAEGGMEEEGGEDFKMGMRKMAGQVT